MNRDARAARRYLVWVLVAVGHAFFVVFLLRHEGSMVAQRGQNTWQLLLLDLSSLDRSPPATPLDATQAPKPKVSGQMTPISLDSDLRGGGLAASDALFDNVRKNTSAAVSANEILIRKQRSEGFLLTTTFKDRRFIAPVCRGKQFAKLI